MNVLTLTINGQLVSGRDGATILEAAREADIAIPTMCYAEGLSAHGGCRMCLVEIEGMSRLHPACFMQIQEGMVVHSETHELQEYRRILVEMLSAEGNHICSVCVANGNCELQDAAMAVGMDHQRLDYQYPNRQVDVSHERFGIDHNRCILCTRCIRACDELEGAHTLDLAGRGTNSKLIVDLDQSWGTSETCTSCGKCFMACPTGAIFRRGSSVAEMDHGRTQLDFLVNAREKKLWHV